MQHCNGNQIIAIDIGTTGGDPTIHEITQIALIPLDANLMVRKDVRPFYVNMKPENPETADPKVISMEKLLDVAQRGFDQETVKDMLIDWIENKLKLAYSSYGKRKQITPLGHNYAFDHAFLNRWLGVEMYNEYFMSTYRDTMTTALYLNDNRSFHGCDVEFRRVSLSELANILKIEHNRAHDALADAYVTSQCYKKMCQRGLL
jgi:DNA polymerase III epsilon subunit-like protein